VAHHLLDRFRVGSGVDQERGEGVPALMQRERGQKRRRSTLGLGRFPLVEIASPPGALRSTVDGGRIEDLIGSATEDALRAGPPFSAVARLEARGGPPTAESST
jgi:hypothetical protein